MLAFPVTLLLLMQALQISGRPAVQPATGRRNDRRDPVARAFLIVIAAGLVWRLTRFFLDFEITGDEAGILRSVIERGYGDLLHPLSYSNVSPPLFLWLTKWVDSVFPTQWAVRFLPFLASLGAMAMFGLICRETLAGAARWLAWAVLSLAWVPIVEGTRVKSYTLDLFAATLMLWLALRWLLHGRQARYLLWLGLCAPVFVWLSYTSVFIVGAISLVFTGCAAQTCFQPGDSAESKKLGWQNVSAGLAFMALAGVSAIFLYELNVRPALQASLTNGLSDGWSRGYPPAHWSEVPLWLLTVHTGRGFAWPVGDNNFGSSATFALWLIGLAAYWRRGNRWVWWLFVAPQILGLAAGFLHKYPYLQNPRLCMYLGPGICLFVGAGMQWLVERLAEEKRRGCYSATAFALMLLAVGGLGWDITRRVREFNGPGIRRTLVEAGRQIGADGCFVILNDERTSSVLTYYLERKVARKTWLNGEKPVAPGGKLALVAVASEIAPADTNALLHNFEQRWGRPLQVEWSQTAHQVLLDNRDSVIVWVCEQMNDPKPLATLNRANERPTAPTH